MISKEDKRAHPVFYWTLLILLALCAFQLFSIAIGEVQGAWTANTYNTTTDDSWAHLHGDHFVHTKDDKYAVPYVNSDDELWIAHKPTTGGSWEYDPISIIYSDYVTCGIVCSSNNTLVVASLRSTTAEVWVKWSGSDWDEWTGYPIDAASYLNDIAINNTDNIAVGYVKSNVGYVEIFNLTSKTSTANTVFSSGANAEVSIMANHSGDFYVFYGVGGGNHYLRDFNKTKPIITVAGYTWRGRLYCLANDRFAITGHSIYGATSTVFWGYQANSGSDFTCWGLSTLPSSTTWLHSPKAILSQDSLTITIIGMDTTNTKLYQWQAAWNAVSATWKASETEIASGTTYYPLGASNSVWPRAYGVSWCQPKNGQAIHMVRYEATRSMQIWTQSVIWTPDLTTAWPEITTSGLDQGTYDELYSFGMSKSGGTAPFQWTIVSGPVWLEIGLTTGILSGTPPGVGTFVVEIQLADVIPRTDTESFNLKINPAETPYTPPTEETVSFKDLHLGDLWIVLACVSIVVGLSRIITRGARI